jgi:hypothetical protein
MIGVAEPSLGVDFHASMEIFASHVNRGIPAIDLQSSTVRVLGFRLAVDREMTAVKIDALSRPPAGDAGRIVRGERRSSEC